MVQDNQPPEQSGNKFNLLVVEDSGIQAKVLVQTLRSLGYSNIQAAPNANAALDHLKRSKFDLILCDWQMPGKSGIDFLKELRQMPEFKTLPFIFITAQAEKKLVIEALQAGAQDYIVKPPNAELIGSKLASILGK